MNLYGYCEIAYFALPWWQRILPRLQTKKWITVERKGEKYFQRTKETWFAEGNTIYIASLPDDFRIDSKENS